MLSRFRSSGNNLLSADAWKTRIVFWGGAAMVGLVASGFAIVTEQANGVFDRILGYSPWIPFLLSPLGMMLVVWLTQRLVPGSEGSGIPQAIAALDMREPVTRGKLLSLRIAVGKIILTLLGVLSGASIGREGPTVHVGASIMFSLGRFAKFPYHYMDRGLILAGAAAGLGAAFNTPLAGILFAIEEMSRSFEERTSGTLLTAVVLAGITAVGIQGNYTYFGSTTATLEPRDVVLPILICGIVGGLAGGSFSAILIWGSKRIAPLVKRHPLPIAFACGMTIAVVGYLSGNLTFGTGYHQAKEIITGTGTLPASYPFLKALATLASYLSGIPGGLFAPSLATGAGVGAGIADWLPGLPAAAVVILGMVGYFSGVVQTPITAFVIVMEMTDNSGLLLPLMATSFLAYLTSRLVCPEPVYQSLAGMFLPTKPPVPPRTDAAATPADPADPADGSAPAKPGE